MYVCMCVCMCVFRACTGDGQGERETVNPKHALDCQRRVQCSVLSHNPRDQKSSLTLNQLSHLGAPAMYIFFNLDTFSSFFLKEIFYFYLFSKDFFFF